MKSWKHHGVPHPNRHAALLKKGIKLLHDHRPAISQLGADALPEQPFDEHLLDLSGIYRRSRELYLQQGGVFHSALVTSPRSLSSAILVEQKIEFSPIEKEMIWSATDPAQSQNPNTLLQLRTYICGVYHEQNHRILWKFLPPPPRDRAGLFRYLNFAESLVITLDMALADTLGPKLSLLFYLSGAIYDPGTTVKEEVRDSRLYRNYLQAALYATYLNLEFYSKEDILKIIKHLFPNLGKWGERAVHRSCNLDRAFVEQTNPLWQIRNVKPTLKALATQNVSPLKLPKEPTANHLHYLWAEKAFDLFDIH